MTIELQGLVGTNPLGLFAALGTLAAVDRQAPHLGARLWWAEGVVPRARLEGPSDIGALVELLEEDRQYWLDSLILRSGPEGEPVAEVKPTESGIRSWAQLVREVSTRSNRRDADHFQALLAEYALSGSNDAKPSHLHFTAGQQRFLDTARDLNHKVDSGALLEALVGPWRYESSLHSFGWDASRGERIYALRGTNPSKDKKAGVPGADWLAFVGLTFLPSAKNGGSGNDQLVTTGCRGTWKDGSFRWPLWRVPLSGPVIHSLLAYEGLVDESDEQRRRRGVFRVLEAPIRRSDQGGYGSFGPAGSPEKPRSRPSRAGDVQRAAYM
jgi:hypothetical protein